MNKVFLFIKENLKFFVIIIFSTIGFLGFKLKLQPDIETDKVILNLIKQILINGHYEPSELNEDFYISVFDKFIEGLDPAHRYFLASDIQEFSEYRNKIDDFISDNQLSFYHLVYSRFQQRIKESKIYYPEILKKPFNYDIEEYFSVSYENRPFAKDSLEIIDMWRLQLKANTISKIYDDISAQEEKKKNDSTGNFKEKDFAFFEKKARENTLKNMQEFYDALEDVDQSEWFATYVNSIAETFDPHTVYFPPVQKKRFDINISGQLEGIGARLQKKGDYTRVVELISGGPAWREGELEVGDLILKVGQADKEPVDIVGMRLDKAIEYIKGKKGTVVKLTVKKIDGTLQTIPITRDVVELDETFAKSSIIEKGNRTFGMIKLPKFYIDFNKKSKRNAAHDMENEIEELKKQNIEGLIIDLRNNGGGSLSTAVDIVGLFVGKGPVVQIKNRNKEAVVRYDENKKIKWNGPLVILVNELSASASEILAAAMQDYKRAIIVGSKQTYGKGTVQSIYSLNDQITYPSELGAIKITIQKFYRITGGSTQLKGVHSDVAIPDRYSYMDLGERDQENALGWDKIDKTEYKTWNHYINYDKVIENSNKRISEDPKFKLIDKNARWLKSIQDETLIPLNFQDYKTSIELNEQEGKKFKKIYDYQNNLTFSSPLYEKILLEKDTVLREKRRAWHKNLKKDIYIDEAFKVLYELKIDNPK